MDGFRMPAGACESGQKLPPCKSAFKGRIAADVSKSSEIRRVARMTRLTVRAVHGYLVRERVAGGRDDSGRHEDWNDDRWHEARNENGTAMKILQAEYLLAAAEPEGCPETGLPEFAFVGRSNVGKSSLINLLLGRRSLARSSATPGKTRLIQFFRVAAQAELAPDSELGSKPASKSASERGVAAAAPQTYSFLCADLPGYGYAKVSKEERESWRTLIEGYLAQRSTLRAVLLLQDVRRDLREEEVELLDWFCERRIPVLVVLTKLDKLTNREQRERVALLTQAFGVPSECVFATSATKRSGAQRVLAALEEILQATP